MSFEYVRNRMKCLDYERTQSYFCNKPVYIVIDFFFFFLTKIRHVYRIPNALIMVFMETKSARLV